MDFNKWLEGIQQESTIQTIKGTDSNSTYVVLGQHKGWVIGVRSLAASLTLDGAKDIWLCFGFRIRIVKGAEVFTPLEEVVKVPVKMRSKTHTSFMFMYPMITIPYGKDQLYKHWVEAGKQGFYDAFVKCLDSYFLNKITVEEIVWDALISNFQLLEENAPPKIYSGDGLVF